MSILTFSDADLVPVSALQHFSYCPRQCGLIHLDQAWDENLYTLRGERVHEIVDEPGGSIEKGVRIQRGMPIWCDRLGLVGKADVVEFHQGVPLPVEYKHGPKRASQHDDLQLAAQAVCLEEMFGVLVPLGAIFHHSSRRRREVKITPALRQHVERTILDLREMIRGGQLPAAVNDARCPKCSLIQSCLPSVTDQPNRSQRVLRSLFVVSDS
jgi:CRISPR-associated exonuclease Cas4